MTAFYRTCCVRLAMVLLVVSAEGCGKPDYPTVTYPPDGVTFPNPDVSTTLGPFDISGDSPVQLDPIVAPCPVAKIQLEVSAHGDSEDPVWSFMVNLTRPDGTPVVGGSGGLMPGNEPEAPRTGFTSFLGPSTPGEYEMTVLVMVVEPDEPEPEKKWTEVAHGTLVVNAQ